MFAGGQPNNQLRVGARAKRIDYRKRMTGQGMIRINDRDVTDDPINNGGIVCSLVPQSRRANAQWEADW